MHDRASGVDLNTMAAPFVTLHVAAHAEGFATTGLRALERLLPGVRVAVDAQAAGAAESLVASRADVAVLSLRVEVTGSRVEVVVMRPADGTRRRSDVNGYIHRWERLGKRSLILHAVPVRWALRLSSRWPGWWSCSRGEVAAVGVPL